MTNKLLSRSKWRDLSECLLRTRTPHKVRASGSNRTIRGVKRGRADDFGRMLLVSCIFK